MFDTTLRLLLRRLGLLLVLYMLLRLAFYLFNFSTFAAAPAAETFFAFLHGLRFDLAAIAAVNAPFILLSLFPHGNTSSKTFQRVLQGLFLLLNAPFVALAMADLEFFKFIGKRSGNELFTITADIEAQLGQLIGYYWYLVLGFGVLLLMLAGLYPKHSQPQNQPTGILFRYLRLLLVAALVVVAIRGGWQLKPLRVSHAFVVEPAVLGHLTLNSPFTFIKSIGKPQLETKSYFPGDAALLAALQFDPGKYNHKQNQKTGAQKENVVIILLESFAAEYVGALNGGKGYTPFLDSLATQGLFYQHAFANGRKSIEALPSVLAGLPSLMQEPYITSVYQSNTLYGLGNILQESGYRTAFFHGAANGTMGFNNFSKLVGMQEYYGLDEYPAAWRDKDFDGQWGIFDEPYLQYVAHTLNQFEQPFLATLFTLSSHQPYTVPAQYKGRFPKGELEIHESIGYADHALREFFRTASQQPWYHNTLFVLTADHTQKSTDPAYQNELGYFRVPLLLFHPGNSLSKGSSDKIAQHADIVPTVVDYLNLSTDRLLPFGTSLLDSTTTGRALLYNGNAYFLVQQNTVATLTQDDQVQFYTFADLAPAPEAPMQAQQLKAFVQYFRNAMAGNRLYFWNEGVKE